MGGWPWSAFKDIISEKGIDSDDAYPYTGAKSDCRAAAADMKPTATIDAFACLAADEDALRRWLLHHGPISVALDARPLFLYKGGVAAPPSCSSLELDHAVLLTGYGVECVRCPRRPY